VNHQTLLITGASGGFGRGAAEALARRGHRVYATMRSVDGRNREPADALRQLADRDGLDLTPVDLDVTDTASVEAAVEGVVAEAGRLDAVVNNAGQMFVGVTEAFTPDQFAAQLDVNLVGPFRVVRAALPQMRAQRSGLFLHMSSAAGRIASPFFALYHASKHGLEALAESLRYELAPYGIDSCVLEPGPFATGLFATAPGPADADREAANAELRPVLDGMLGGFGQVMESPDVPTDPRLVVDEVVRLVEAPAGERPLRTVVGFDLGVVRRLNEATEPYAREVLDVFRIGHHEQPLTPA